jgi:hypothetical protein
MYENKYYVNINMQSQSIFNVGDIFSERFIKSGSTSNDILLGDGSTTPISSISIEGYTTSGSISNNDLLITIGSGSTNVIIDDTNKNIKFTGDRVTYFTNEAPLVDTAIFHKQTQNKGGFYVNTLTQLEKNGGSGTYLGEYKMVNNTSNDNESGTIGRRIDVSKRGIMNAQLLYGDFIDISHDGGGRTDFMIGQPMNVIVNNSDSTNSVGIMRGTSINMEITNPNAVVDVLQAMHPSLNLTAGEVGTAQVLFLDIDKNNQINITGDISYIEANDDAMGTLTVGGKKRFIKYLGNLESDLSGSINTHISIDTINSGSNKILPTKEWVVDHIESASIKEENVISTVVEPTIISGSYTFDTSAGKFFVATLTEVTTINMPTLDNSTAIAFTAIINGNHTLLLPNCDITPSSDDYDGTVRNRLIFDCYKLSNGTQVNNVSIENLAT